MLPVFAAVLIMAGCSDDANETVRPTAAGRNDSATLMAIALDGSLQNAAWSPSSDAVVFTRFRNGYNEGPADLYVYSMESGSARILVSDGSDNVNLPGSCWNETTGEIVFSSSRDPHDEIFKIRADGTPGDEMTVTGRANKMAYEPSVSPDGQWVVLESHPVDVEASGTIMKCRMNGGAGYEELTTPEEDCRQPNWSPAGDMILYQRLSSGQWDIWVMNADGTGARQVTTGPGDKTDASFSPSGRWIVYSSDYGLNYGNIYAIPVAGGSALRITNHDGYDGAPSWSGSGRIVFESCDGQPDGSSGTRLWVINAPVD